VWPPPTRTGEPWHWQAVDADAAEEIVQAITQGHKDAAQTLDVWFRPGPGQALRLRRQVRDAVTPLLRGSRALLATGGRVTRRAELLRIAGAVESAGSDEDAWRVWCATTGLWGARHLSGTPADPEVPPRTSFWNATGDSYRCDLAQARHPLGEGTACPRSEPSRGTPGGAACRDIAACRGRARRAGHCQPVRRLPRRVSMLRSPVPRC